MSHWNHYINRLRGTTSLSVPLPAEQGFTYTGSLSFGTSVTMNPAGTVAAASSPAGTNKFIKVYKFTAPDWVLQQTLTTSLTTVSTYGSRVKVSDDGLTLLVTDASDSTTGAQMGLVYVYTRTSINNQFTLLQTIASPNVSASINFGQGITLTPDKQYMVVGSPGDDTPANSTGAIWIYKFNGTQYAQIAGPVRSPTTLAAFGTHVDVSRSPADPTKWMFAVGAPSLAVGGSLYGGEIYLITLDPTNDSYVIKSPSAQSFGGVKLFDQRGASFDLSPDGQMFLVGAGNGQNTNNTIKLYKWNSSTNNYDLFWFSTNTATGYGGSVALSDDKSTIISTYYGVGVLVQGLIRFKINSSGTAYDQVESLSKDNTYASLFGISTAINSDGKKILVGERSENTNGTNAGKITFYNK